MENILKFLSWKKSVIATIIMAIVAYLATKGIIWEAEVVMISSIVAALFGTASAATQKIYSKEK